jgi:hypothetical protein
MEEGNNTAESLNAGNMKWLRYLPLVKLPGLDLRSENEVAAEAIYGSSQNAVPYEDGADWRCMRGRLNEAAAEFAGQERAGHDVARSSGLKLVKLAINSSASR